MSATDPSRPGVVLLAQTLAAIVIASIAIRLLPFDQLSRTMVRRRARSGSGAHPDVAPFQVIEPLRRALEAWGRRLPWRTLCFETGLAAHWLLGRAGYSSTLTLGAAHEEDGLIAHVWVRSDQRDVIGCDLAEQFIVLSRFSNGSTS